MIFLITIMLKVGYYLEWAKRSPVRTGCCHGIIYICNTYNHGKGINKFLCEVGWIACAVAPLVVHKGSLFNSGINGLVLKNVIAILRVHLNHGKFFISQFARLVEYLIRYLDFTYVVQ